jgi:hypothetical protein
MVRAVSGAAPSARPTVAETEHFSSSGIRRLQLGETSQATEFASAIVQLSWPGLLLVWRDLRRVIPRRLVLQIVRAGICSRRRSIFAGSDSCHPRLGVAADGLGAIFCTGFGARPAGG